MACALYDEAWLQARALEITLRHLELVRDLHAAAMGAYESGVGSQQDPLRVELEEAELLHQQVEVETAQRTTAAQLAALLHLGDGAAIPPLPEVLPTLAAPSDPNETLAEQALHERPELRAADARIAAKRAAEALARREFFPDFKIVGAYDTFWELLTSGPSSASNGTCRCRSVAGVRRSTRRAPKPSRRVSSARARRTRSAPRSRAPPRGCAKATTCSPSRATA
jgi:hypothetical protein